MRVLTITAEDVSGRPKMSARNWASGQQFGFRKCAIGNSTYKEVSATPTSARAFYIVIAARIGYRNNAERLFLHPLRESMRTVYLAGALVLDSTLDDHRSDGRMGVPLLVVPSKHVL